MFLLGNQKAGKVDNGQMTQQSTQAVRSSLIVLFIQIVTNCNDFSDWLAYFNKQCLLSVKMEIPRHVIFAFYWLSLKSSQSSIEATEYVEGNVGDILFIWKRVFFFFSSCNAALRRQNISSRLNNVRFECMLSGFLMENSSCHSGVPFIMHFFTEGSMFQKLGLRTRINFSLSKGVIPL